MVCLPFFTSFLFKNIKYANKINETKTNVKIPRVLLLKIANKIAVSKITSFKNN